MTLQTDRTSAGDTAEAHIIIITYMGMQPAAHHTSLARTNQLLTPQCGLILRWQPLLHSPMPLRIKCGLIKHVCEKQLSRDKAEIVVHASLMNGLSR